MKKKHAQNDNQFLLVSQNAPFAYQEAFKSLRTNLQFLSVENACRKIIVTSAVPGEQKTSLAVNLAVTMADAGSRVLLIDCDLRKPTVHRYLRIDNKAYKGLSKALSGRQLKDAIVAFKGMSLHVIIADMVPPNPAEILGSARMGALIGALESHYDYIIFDTPPVSVVTDAAVLSRYADGVVLAVRQNYATIDQIQRAKKNLQAVNANILGAVLTDFDLKAASKTSGYGYGGGYGGYGSYADTYAYHSDGEAGAYTYDEDDEELQEV